MKLGVLLAATALCRGVAAADCFSHDGVLYNNSIYANESAYPLVVCNPSTQYSTCCFSYQTCSTDNICRFNGGQSRQYCTDKTWSSPACSPLCPNWNTAGVGLTQCPNGSYCCTINNIACCNLGLGTFINATTGQNITGAAASLSRSSSTTTSFPSISSSASSSSSSSSLSSAAAASSSSASTTTILTTSSSTHTTTTILAASATATLTSVPIKEQALSGGAIAGIAIGAVAGLALLAALLYFLVYKKSRANPAETAPLYGEYKHQHSAGEAYNGPAMEDAKSHLMPAQELDAQRAVHEIGGEGSGPVELEARDPREFKGGFR